MLELLKTFLDRERTYFFREGRLSMQLKVLKCEIFPETDPQEMAVSLEGGVIITIYSDDIVRLATENIAENGWTLKVMSFDNTTVGYFVGAYETTFKETNLES